MEVWIVAAVLLAGWGVWVTLRLQRGGTRTTALEARVAALEAERDAEAAARTDRARQVVAAIRQRRRPKKD